MAEDGPVDTICCARCGEPVRDPSAVTYWDDRAYCQTCLHSSGMDRYDPTIDHPEETLTLRFWPSVGLGICSGFIITGMVTALVFGFFLLLMLAGLLGGMLPLPAKLDGLVRLLKGMLLFLVFAMAFMSVIGIPMGLFGTIFMRRRSVRASHGQISATAFGRSVTIPLHGCTWIVSANCVDGCTYISLTRPSIIVRAKAEFLVCGFTDQSREFWHSFLTLTVGPPVPKFRWQRNLGTAALHSMVGLVTGWIIGFLIYSVSGSQVWMTICIFLGILDGVVSGGWALIRGHPQADKLLPKAWAFVIIFAGVGAKIGLTARLEGLIVGMVVNGIVGLLVAWIARRHLDESHEEVELT